jgi:hypothetical protein
MIQRMFHKPVLKRSHPTHLNYHQGDLPRLEPYFFLRKISRKDFACLSEELGKTSASLFLQFDNPNELQPCKGSSWDSKQFLLMHKSSSLATTTSTLEAYNFSYRILKNPQILAVPFLGHKR